MHGSTPSFNTALLLWYSPKRKDNNMRLSQMVSPTRGVAACPHPHHDSVSPGGISRRGFLRGAVGTAALGAAAGTGLLGTTGVLASGPGIGLVLPIPTTVEFFPGVKSHVQAPPFLAGPDSDPATVTNFTGVSGIAFIDGLVDRRNRRTGETRTLPFRFNDMRFMQGKFRGRDGHVRDATFAFI